MYSPPAGKRSAVSTFRGVAAQDGLLETCTSGKNVSPPSTVTATTISWQRKFPLIVLCAPVVTGVVPGDCYKAFSVHGNGRRPGLRGRITRMVDSNRFRPRLAPILGMPELNAVQFRCWTDVIRPVAKHRERRPSTPAVARLRYKQWLRKRLAAIARDYHPVRSEEHTSELQSRGHLVCRLLLEKKK